LGTGFDDGIAATVEGGCIATTFREKPMQTRSHTAVTLKPRLTLTARELLAWIVERDRLFRERRTLGRMPAERLEDIGMTAGDVAYAYRDGR